MNLVLVSLQRLVQILLVLLVGLVATFFIVLFSTRQVVNEQVRTQLGLLATDASGLFIEVGEVRGDWWAGLNLRDVKIHETEKPTSGVLITVPLVQVDYSLLSFMGPRPRPIRVDAYHANLTAVIGKDHLMRFKPLEKPVKPMERPLPAVDIVIHSGHVAYEDQGARKPFVAEVGNVTGEGRLEGYDLHMKLQALRDADPIHADVHYSFKHPGGEVRAQARGVSIPYFVNRFGYAPEYTMTGGKADLDVLVSWTDPIDKKMSSVKLDGKAKIYDGSATVKNTERPVEHIRGEVTLREQYALVDWFQADIAGMPLEGTGRVDRLMEPQPTNMPDPILKLSVVAPEVKLEKLSELFPGMKSLGLQGDGRITARVTGTSVDPRVAMLGVVPSGHYGKEPVTNFHIAANYKKGEVDMPAISLEAAGGSGIGAAWVGLPEDEKAPIPYRVSADFKRLDLAALIGRHTTQPMPAPVTGKLAASFKLAGVGARVETTAGAAVTEGTIAGKPVEHFHTRYHVKNGRWEVPELALRWSGTTLAASMSGGEAGDFKLKAQVPHAELAQLAKLSPKPLAMPISGALEAEATVSGRFGKPETWVGQGRLALADARLDRQPIPHAAVNLSLRDNQLQLADGRVAVLGGRVDWHGTVAPAIADKPEQLGASLSVAAHGLDLARVASLPPEMRELQAKADGRFDVTVANGAWRVAGQVGAKQLRHPAWGHLDGVEATLVADPAKLSLQLLTLRQGAERVHAVGTVSLGAKPRLDVHVHAGNAQVATLLGAVDWNQVEQALNPRAAAARKPVGPEQGRGGLPGHETYALNEAISLSSGLEHWLAWRKAPLDRPAPAPAILPFWDGTKGRLTLDAHLTGPADQPHVALTADVKELELFRRHVDQAEAALDWDGKRLVLHRLRVREGGRVVLTGGGAFSDSRGDTLVLAAHDMDLAWSRRALTPQRMKLDGHGTVMLHLSGPMNDPRLAAEGTLVNGEFSGHGFDPVAFERIEAELGYERGRLAIRRASLRQEGKEASVTGSVPVAEGTRGSTAPIDLAFRLEDGNLGIVNLFSQNQFHWLGGKGFAEVRLGGTMLHPTLAGQIKLDEGRFTAKGLDTPVEHVSADVVLADDKVLIKGLQGHYGGGDVEILGEVFLDQFKPDRVNLTALARPFRLQLTNDYYQGMVEANLRLTGSVAQPQLSGLVALRDGVITMKDDAKPSQAPPKDPNPLRLQNLQVALGPNLRIKNAVMDVAVTTQQRQGHLRVDGPLAAPTPRGVVILESGTIRPLNNPFKIVEGRVEFLGEQVHTEDDLMDILAPEATADPAANLNAKLDIQARTTVYDYKESEPINLQANVTGSLQQMEMRFTSEPMRSQQEILDMLSKKQVIAQTFNGKLDGGQVIVKEVGGLVSSNIEELISPYTLYLRNVLNLQTFRVELVPDYNNTSTAAVAGFKPALTLETRPLLDRFSLGSRLVAGQMYSTSPTALLADRTYFGLNWKFNRFLSFQYRVDPVIDQANERVFGQTLGFKAQVSY